MLRLSEAAALYGPSLSNYVRQWLSADDTLQEELTLLRQILADPGHLHETLLAAIETTYLMRAMAKPEQIAIVQQNMQRQL